MIDRHTQHEQLRQDLARQAAHKSQTAIDAQGRQVEPPSTQFQSFKLPKVREATKPSIAHIPFGIPKLKKDPAE